MPETDTNELNKRDRVVAYTNGCLALGEWFGCTMAEVPTEDGQVLIKAMCLEDCEFIGAETDASH